MTDNRDSILGELVASAQKLVESVSYDVHGAPVGNQWVGGHGGLVSLDTLKQGDAVRRICDRARKAFGIDEANA